MIVTAGSLANLPGRLLLDLTWLLSQGFWEGTRLGQLRLLSRL